MSIGLGRGTNVWGLIGSIGAVDLSVAAPRGRHTMGSRAGEGTREVSWRAGRYGSGASRPAAAQALGQTCARAAAADRATETRV